MEKVSNKILLCLYVKNLSTVLTELMTILTYWNVMKVIIKFDSEACIWSECGNIVL
jgi:hypothetical protein